MITGRPDSNKVLSGIMASTALPSGSAWLDDCKIEAPRDATELVAGVVQNSSGAAGLSRDIGSHGGCSKMAHGGLGSGFVIVALVH